MSCFQVHYSVLKSPHTIPGEVIGQRGTSGCWVNFSSPERILSAGSLGTLQGLQGRRRQMGTVDGNFVDFGAGPDAKAKNLTVDLLQLLWYMVILRRFDFQLVSPFPSKILRMYLLVFLGVFACMYMCTICVPGPQGSQRVLDLLELSYN